MVTRGGEGDPSEKARTTDFQSPLPLPAPSSVPLTSPVAALLQLQAALQSTAPGVLSTWGGEGSPCEKAWTTDIRCDPVTRRVVHLDLKRAGLVGNIPTFELSQFDALTFLDLTANNFSAFNGQAFILQMTSLQHLSLAKNNMKWFPTDVDMLTSLTFLDLSNNKFDGQIPADIFQLRNLEVLSLENNLFTGSVPRALSNLVRLKTLNLGKNDFYGPLPQFFGALHDLVNLKMDLNRFEGTIPETYAILRNLRRLDLSSNKDLTGPLPSFLGELGLLQSLSLDDCDFTGGLLESLARLPYLTELFLEHNRFEGTIPEAYGHFPRIVSLYLSNNRLTGEIPESMCGLETAELLVLERNELTGPVPPCMLQLQGLLILDVSENYLTGTLPRPPPGSPMQFVHMNNCFDNVADNSPSCPVAPPGGGEEQIGAPVDQQGGSPPDQQVGNPLDQQPGGDVNQQVGVPIDREGGGSVSQNVGVPQQRTGGGSIEQQVPGGVPVPGVTTPPCPDMSQLVALQAALRMDSPDALQTWDQGSDPCDGTWETEVICDPMTGHVIRLDLRRANLSGAIPAAELAQLNRLTYLDLGGNEFSSFIQQEFLERLTRLEHLSLADNQLQWFPTFINTLTRLTSLDLSTNKFTGDFPEDVLVMPNLLHLKLEENHFSGSVPDAITALSKLRSITLANNNFTGLLPESFAQLTSLQAINLAGNQFSGPLPQSYAGLTNMVFFKVATNDLEGGIPDWLGTWPRLNHLSLFHNRFTGPIPDSLGNAKNLATLVLDENRLTGSLPDALSALTNLEAFYAVGNQLEGTVPDSYSSLQKLRYIDLSFNTKITGALPEFLSGIVSLKSIAFEECDFTGSLPVGYAKLPSLTELYLDRNNLEGSIPGLYGDMPNLATLYLSSNQLSGEIPGSFCRLGKAKTIVLARNELRGSIPDCLISNLKELRLLDVSDNYLTGPVPAVPAGGPLQFDFSSNCLDTSEGAQRNPCPASPVAPTQPPPNEAAPRQPGGTEPSPAETTVDPSASSALPSPDAITLMEMLAGLRAAAGTDVLPSWTQDSDPCDGSWATSIKCDNRTRQVVHLDLRRADLVGDVPCFGLSQLNALTYLDLGSNNFTFFRQAPFCQQMTNLQHVSLAENQLKYWPETVVAYWPKLTFLSLAANLLSGPIPEDIGDQLSTTLVHLDLMGNYFNGTVPSSISALQKLRYIDLSFSSNLTGPVPEALAKIETLRTINLEGCSFTGVLPESYSQLPFLASLYLDKNGLDGAIPASYGYIPSLVNLYLSNNELSGHIPESLCRLQKAEAIVLERNSIGGTIPACLVTMESLLILDVTGNYLKGPIPTVEEGSILQFLYAGNCLDGQDRGNDPCPIETATDPNNRLPPGSHQNQPLWEGNAQTPEENAWPGTPTWGEAQAAAAAVPAPSSPPVDWKPILSYVFLALLSVAFVFLLCSAFSMLAKRRRYTAVDFSAPRVDQLPVTEYGLSKIKRATKNFTTVFGKGSFGTVYLADDFLPDQIEPRAIVKRAHEPEKMTEAQFREKVQLLAKARHRYLVSLRGYCIGKAERILVFEFLPHGSLFDRLHRSDVDPLPWDARVHVAVNLASALAFLHHGCDPPLVHRAVTSSNILLSADMSAKLSDFGLARGSTSHAAFDEPPRRRPNRRQRGAAAAGRDDASASSSLTAVGSGGDSSSEAESELLQPVVTRTDARKLDIYGFGVVLLELITGQKAMKDVHITSLAAPFLEDTQMMPLMVDSALGGFFNQSELIELATIARDCVKEDSNSRPTMLEVVRTMEGSIELAVDLFDPLDSADSGAGSAKAGTPKTGGAGYAALSGGSGIAGDAMGSGGVGSGSGVSGRQGSGGGTWASLELFSGSFGRRSGREREAGGGRGGGAGQGGVERGDVEAGSSLLYITPKDA
ncbi:unnamed protein product [Closterium sp. Yama58-4]|nr:unnamed protein product [Closterium sp. Yama58-4]